MYIYAHVSLEIKRNAVGLLGVRLNLSMYMWIPLFRAPSAYQRFRGDIWILGCYSNPETPLS